MKKVLISVLVLIMAFMLVGCGPKTLSDLGGSLRYEVDEYTIMYVDFFGKEPCSDGHTNCCVQRLSIYRDNPVSPSGKSLDTNAGGSQHIPCTFTENTLTMNEVDNYTYSVEKIGEREYVVFSKPFLGHIKWHINK